MHLLIIDDDDIDSEVIVKAVEKLYDNLKITAVSSGTIGLNEIVNETFDCAFLDYRLPDLDGLEFLELLSSIDDKPTTPVVMLTGEGNERIAVKAMKMGAFDYIPKKDISSNLINKAIKDAVETTKLKRKLKEAQAHIAKLAHYDPLTGLANRNLFLREIDHLVASSEREQKQFSLFIMDLNGFKEVNDTLGHKAGDCVLAEVGTRLDRISREADQVFRIGGDEFAILVDTSVSTEGVTVMAQKIIDEVQQPIRFANHEKTVGISIGISFYPLGGKNSDDLIHSADNAMYLAKKSGHRFQLSEELHSQKQNLKIIN